MICVSSRASYFLFSLTHDLRVESFLDDRGTDRCSITTVVRSIHNDRATRTTCELSIQIAQILLVPRRHHFFLVCLLRPKAILAHRMPVMKLLPNEPLLLLGPEQIILRLVPTARVCPTASVRAVPLSLPHLRAAILRTRRVANIPRHLARIDSESQGSSSRLLHRSGQLTKSFTVFWRPRHNLTIDACGVRRLRLLLRHLGTLVLAIIVPRYMISWRLLGFRRRGRRRSGFFLLACVAPPRVSTTTERLFFFLACVTTERGRKMAPRFPRTRPWYHNAPTKPLEMREVQKKNLCQHGYGLKLILALFVTLESGKKFSRRCACCY